MFDFNHNIYSQIIFQYLHFFSDFRKIPLTNSTSSNTPNTPPTIVTTLKPIPSIDKAEDIDPENSVALNLIRIKSNTPITHHNSKIFNGGCGENLSNTKNNNNNCKSIKSKIELQSSLFRPKPEVDLLLLDECKKYNKNNKNNNNNRIGTPPSPLNNNQSSSYCENDENNDECKSSLKLNKLGKFRFDLIKIVRIEKNFIYINYMIFRNYFYILP